MYYETYYKHNENIKLIGASVGEPPSSDANGTFFYWGEPHTSELNDGFSYICRTYVVP